MLEERLTRERVTHAPAVAPRTVHLEYKRFGLFHRWMHWLVMASFVVLVFTGMPLEYKNTAWAKLEMHVIGGVQTAGIAHRLAALVMVFSVVCELVYFGLYILRGKGPLWGPGTIVPAREDWRDMKGMFRWFLGKGTRPQAFDRFTYWEKFEFWAASGGVMTMVATGFMLWFPEQTARFLPGIFLNLAMTNHAGGALLAMGFVFVFWHVFHAHFRPEVFPMDKVMFNGTVPVDEYAVERPLEFERRVRSGTLDEVLVEAAGAKRKALENVAWWTITIAAFVAWAVFALFTVWLMYVWMGF
jgi:cytochrome b subunit of formate dehydrogenase